MNPETDVNPHSGSGSLRAQRLRQVLKKVLDSATGKISDKSIKKVYEDIIQMVSKSN